MDLEQGQEVFIMDDLSQRKLPLSFRYYDPIIKIIFNRMTEDSKLYFSQQADHKLTELKREEIWNKIKTWFIEDENDP